MTKRYYFLFCFLFSLFVALYVMLCWNSRLATDDYFFIWDVQNKGIKGSLFLQYMRWSGRFSAGLLVDVIYKYLNTNQSYYFLYPFFSLVFLTTGTYFLVYRISSYYRISVNKYQKHILTFCIVALLFFMSLDIGESWFWYVGLSCYLISIIAFIWGVGFLFSGTHQPFSIIAMIFCFLYIGGASEVYSVIYGVLLTGLIIYRYKRMGNYSAFIESDFNKKLIIAYVTLGLSFILLVAAPGNYLRDGLFPKHQFFYSFFITAKSIVKSLILYLPFKLPYVVIFSTPFVLIGGEIRNSQPNLWSLQFKIFWKRFTLLFAVIVFLFFFLVAYIMVETGPARVWFLLSFLCTIYCCVVCFYAGYSNILKEKQRMILKKTSVLLGVVLMFYHIINQYRITHNYSKAQDARISFLINTNKQLQNDTLITLSPLPPSGMLYSSEISMDTNHFTNREIRLCYNLKFHVISRK